MATAEQVIRLGLRDALKLGEGATPSAAQYAEGLERLNFMIPHTVVENGVRLWEQYAQQVPLVAGTALYAIGTGLTINVPKPVRIIQGFYGNTEEPSREIEMLGWDRYLNLSNRSQQGPVISFLVDKQFDRVNIIAYQVPDAAAAANSGNIGLLCQRPIPALATTASVINFPAEWFHYLHWAYADEICIGQPKAIMDRCSQKRVEALEKLKLWDSDFDSVFIQPDPGPNRSGGGFR